MTEFCHIAPVHVAKQLPELFETQKVHLLLAHLVEKDPAYVEYYVDLKKRVPDIYYHLDNSAFEMVREGKPMFTSDKLLDLADAVRADSIVMSDYPGAPWTKTVESAQRMAPQIKAAGFETFFCPQSEVGDLEGLLRGYRYALVEAPEQIDFIGVSILAAPNAFGIAQQAYGTTKYDEAFRMQRFLARWALMHQLEATGLLAEVGVGDEVGSRHPPVLHMLGLNDGPAELDLILARWGQHVWSWDSSQAIHHGMNHIAFDGSPTALRWGKHETHVQFDSQQALTDGQRYTILTNARYISDRVERWR